MPRLFIAVWPSASALTALRALPRPDERGVRWIPESNLHVTVRFFGDVEIDDAAAHLAGVRLPRATARLGPAVERLNARNIVVPVVGLDELAQHVRDATADVGEPERPVFRGHLTVARTRRGARSTAIGAAIGAEFRVDEVALVASDRRPDGVAYTTIARFPTADSPEPGNP